MLQMHLNVFYVSCISTNVLQWNLRKWTPPIMETSTMRTRVRGPELYSIILQLL